MANRKRNVAYVSQAEPAFLTQFKQRVGYKEGPGVDAKFATPDFDSDDDTPETDEEQPQVVVLKKGDLTADEAAGRIPPGTGNHSTGNTDDPANENTGGRIMFKKPSKRSSDDKSSLSASSVKKLKDSDKSSEKDQSEKKLLKHKSKDKSKKNKNTNLLSFNDEEEEED